MLTPGYFHCFIAAAIAATLSPLSSPLSGYALRCTPLRYFRHIHTFHCHYFAIIAISYTEYYVTTVI